MNSLDNVSICSALPIRQRTAQLRESEIVSVEPRHVVDTSAGLRVRVFDSKGKRYRETPTVDRVLKGGLINGSAVLGVFCLRATTQSGHEILSPVNAADVEREARGIKTPEPMDPSENRKPGGTGGDNSPDVAPDGSLITDEPAKDEPKSTDGFFSHVFSIFKR